MEADSHYLLLYLVSVYVLIYVDLIYFRNELWSFSAKYFVNCIVAQKMLKVHYVQWFSPQSFGEL